MAGSKGCGANMRVTPVGLLDVDLDTLAGLAQLQAGLTHGHPTGLAASELTAYAVCVLRDGAALADAARAARRAGASTSARSTGTTGSATCGSAPASDSPEEFIARGWDECLAVLGRLTHALAPPDDGGDPCRATGEGWIAEEALATALLCAVRHADDPVAALARGATTAGDSDSIAALAGAFVGAAARHGRLAAPTGPTASSTPTSSPPSARPGTDRPPRPARPPGPVRAPAWLAPPGAAGRRHDRLGVPGSRGVRGFGTPRFPGTRVDQRRPGRDDVPARSAAGPTGGQEVGRWRRLRTLRHRSASQRPAWSAKAAELSRIGSVRLR